MTIRRRAVVSAAIVVGVAVAWIVLLPPRPTAQPILFNHAHHAALACAACHSGVERAAHATLPGQETCAKCHATAPAGVSASQWEAFQRAAVTWVTVTRLPDHSMFSHRRHVTLGKLDCSSCHGDIGRRSEPPPRAPIRLDMNACRGCHQQEGASEDCAACHR